MLAITNNRVVALTMSSLVLFQAFSCACRTQEVFGQGLEGNDAGGRTRRRRSPPAHRSPAETGGRMVSGPIKCHWVAVEAPWTWRCGCEAQPPLPNQIGATPGVILKGIGVVLYSS